MKLAIAAALASFTCAAASAQQMSYGQAEYLNSCAVCHGTEGKGDGPLRDLLVKQPADLTHLSQKNGGKFPLFAGLCDD